MSDTEARVAVLPRCDWCDETKAEYDFRTWMGSWGYGCQEHYELHRMYGSLGTGKGQRLISDMMIAAGYPYEEVREE
jgi:hypothetical protein